jgi:8-oxo-dGTP diphosphatase
MPRSAAGIVERDGTYLVALRTPGGDLGGKWEFPGGKLDDGESAEDCLRREFREELDADIAVGPRVGVAHFEHDGKQYELQAYLVSLVSEHLTLREHQRIAWLPKPDIRSLDLAPSDRKLLRYLPG